MMLYTEKQLQEFWHYDCKMRTRNDMPWIPIEEFRIRFESWLDDKVAFNIPRSDVYITPWVEEWIEQEMLDG